MLLCAERAGMAVHVPLDVGNGRRIKDPADAFDDMIPHLRLRKVEQQLVAAQKIGTAKAVMQRPVRMPTVQLAAVVQRAVICWRVVMPTVVGLIQLIICTAQKGCAN